VRLFVAVDPSPHAVAHLQERLAPLRTPDLRWSDPAQWHLTLTFCGEVDERTAERLRERLARAASRAAPMTLRLAGAGAFARPARAHALWVGLAGDIEPLSRLAAATSAAARRVGLEVEDRRFRAHLTVARRSPPGDVRPVVEALADYEGPTWTVDAVHLVRSNLGPPTVHERLATWVLGR
jgi:2'-5' RNA ligase